MTMNSTTKMFKIYTSSYTHMLKLKNQNGSDHIVVASYSGLYEECEFKHISCMS